MEYLVKLLDKKGVAKNTTLFTFEKPEGYKFEPGQYISVRFPEFENDSNVRNYKHTFSICNATKEKYLQIMTRIRDSEYKQNLNSLEIGTKLEITSAGGDFTLPKSTDVQIVFIVGGIGITPVRSMIKEDTGHNWKLIWSNKSKYTTPLFDEFDKKENVVMTMTQDEEWEGERGRITRDMIDKYVERKDNTLYYVVGSNAFTSAMQEILKGENVITEGFGGY